MENVDMKSNLFAHSVIKMEHYKRANTWHSISDAIWLSKLVKILTVMWITVREVKYTDKTQR